MTEIFRFSSVGNGHGGVVVTEKMIEIHNFTRSKPNESIEREAIQWAIMMLSEELEKLTSKG